jgi:hypothetical protein
MAEIIQPIGTQQEIVTSITRWLEAGPTMPLVLQSMWQINTYDANGVQTGQREEWRDVPIVTKGSEDE